MLKKILSRLDKNQKLVDDLTTPKALPMGVADFNFWADRIIAQAGIPIAVGVSTESQKFALADMILNIGATEDYKEDAYFIKNLRKKAINQVAAHQREEIRTQVKARLDAEAKAAAEEVLKKQYVSSEDGTTDELQKQTVQ